jgi:hypothetical protein
VSQRADEIADLLSRHQAPTSSGLCSERSRLQSSLHDCIVHLWPKLVDGGVVFIDEYVLVDYCSPFYSERYWRTYFDTTPPGLIGAGSGIALGQYYLGPFLLTGPFQQLASVAYTFKGNSGFWDYYPDDRAPARPAIGGDAPVKGRGEKGSVTR